MMAKRRRHNPELKEWIGRSYKKGGEIVRGLIEKQVEVIYFEKKCPHGVEMTVVRKMSGRWWYEPRRCKTCTELLEEAERNAET